MLLLLSESEPAADFGSLLLLALIQGLTEFLPISSSGHLVLVQDVMGMKSAALALDVALHLGTLLAILVIFRRDILELWHGLGRRQWREPALLLVAIIPVGLVGFFLRDALAEGFHTPRLVAKCLLATSILLLAGEWGRRRHLHSDRTLTTDVKLWQAVAIGLAQCFAVLPGISRSGTTVAVALIVGVEAKAAIRFSMLISIPTVLGAALLELPHLYEGGESAASSHSGAALMWAVLFAGFVGWGALRMLIAFLGRGAFVWFAVYCAALGSGYLMFGSGS